LAFFCLSAALQPSVSAMAAGAGIGSMTERVYTYPDNKDTNNMVFTQEPV